MRKIPTLFVRHETTYRLINVVTAGCEWVMTGEGIATRKWDGTAILIASGLIYRRYELRPPTPSPIGFFPAQKPHPITGAQPGWIPVTNNPSDRWVREAVINGVPRDGTYELIGPKVNGNPEHRSVHELIPHGNEILETCPRTFEALAEYLQSQAIEGIVWWHPDGRRAKIKRRDFGWPWPIAVTEV